MPEEAFETGVGEPIAQSLQDELDTRSRRLETIIVGGVAAVIVSAAAVLVAVVAVVCVIAKLVLLHFI